MTTPTREQVVQWLRAACDIDTVTHLGRIVLTESQLIGTLGSARADLESTVKEQAAEIERLKREDFSNERVQNDSYKLANKVLHEQLAAAQFHIEQLREALEYINHFSQDSIAKGVLHTALSTQPDLSARNKHDDDIVEACKNLSDRQLATLQDINKELLYFIESLKGDINPERGYASDVENEIVMLLNKYKGLL